MLQLPVEESGGLAKRPGDEDLEALTARNVTIRVITLFFGFFFIQLFPLWQLGGGRTRTLPPEYRTEPVRGMRLRDVHGHKVPLGASVGTLK